MDAPIVFKAEGFNHTLALRIDGFSSEKEKKAFVYAVEREVRNCPEYKIWVAYLVDACGANRCGVTGESIDECKLEIHHHPVGLFAIANAFVEKWVEEKKQFCSFDIAAEIISEHFLGHVGYVPLVTTIHQKFHNGCIRIPMELVKGDYMELIARCNLRGEPLENVKRHMSVTRDDLECAWSAGRYPMSAVAEA